MKAFLYGNGKLLKDFEYMFQNIEILGYCDDKKTQEADCIDNVIKNNTDKFVIIICKRDESSAKKKLEDFGLCYKKDFFLASDLFYQLEPMWKYVKDRDIYIWGTGNIGQVMYEKIGGMEISGYIDQKANESKELSFHEHKVYAPYEKIDVENNFIIIAIANGCETDVEAILNNSGYIKHKDYIFEYQWGIVQELMEKIYYAYPDNSIRFKCRHPFENVRIEADGSINICEPNYIYTSIGNAYESSFMRIWNGVIARLYRLSVKNNTYALCDRNKCPYLKGETSEITGDKLEHAAHTLSDLRLSVDIDPSCNLYCASCRNERCVISEEECREKEFLIQYIKNEILPHTKGLYAAECGDVFFSKIYGKILDEVEKTKHIGLFSNGVLFDKKRVLNWREKCDTMSIRISIDAATETTYNKLRRGGDYQRLIKNLETISELRHKNIIEKFIICFVVQRDNVAEMSEFVKLGKRLNVDYVAFSCLFNWGTYTEEEFNNVTVIKDGKIKKEYKHYFEDDVLKESNVIYYNIPIEGQKSWIYIDRDVRI